MTDTSRVFIKGLPPNFKETDLVSHFSKTAPITDAKHFPHRRIGFVGYKTPDAARSAVKYFNRSFIRTSRITAELAKRVEDRSRGSAATRPFRSVDVVKEPILATKNVTDPSTDEYGAPKPSSKGKFPSEDDVQKPDLSRQSTHPKQDCEVQLSETSEVPTKRRRIGDGNDEQRESLTAHDDSGKSPSKSSDIQIGPLDSHRQTDSKVEKVAPASDTDWLRSRTSRLLDLLDEEGLEDTRKEGEIEIQPDVSPPLAFEDHEDQAAPAQTASEQSVQAGLVLTRDSDDNSNKSDRLFVRNLSYEASEESLEQLFSSFGPVKETHIPTDPRSGASKGYAYVLLGSAEVAQRALECLDGKSFEGRLLHVIPALPKRDKSFDSDAISHLPLKKQKQIKRKVEATAATFRWNALYMNPDAVLESVADRLGVSKSEVLDPTSSDAIVKQAHAETNVIQETKAFFQSQGVNLDSFKGRDLSDTVILIKNFPFATSSEELKRLFEAYGTVNRLLLPPSGTIAIVAMEEPGQARAAFKAIAYRRFKETVLFLEKAPRDVFRTMIQDEPNARPPQEALSQDEEAASTELTSTLFVRNLNFATTSDALRDAFKPLKGFLTARVKSKSNPKTAGEPLSMGFGFIEFRTKKEAEAAAATMSGHALDGHNLIVKHSHRALDAAEERKKEDLAKRAARRRTKIIVKNLPFEATKKDVRALFSPYGKLRSVRVPKKIDQSTRGFAFADFISTQEAENAMSVLQGTHLLGRRLNLDFATEDAVDPEDEIRRMQEKIGKQTEKVSLQRLRSGARKKFSVNPDEEEIDTI